MTLNELAKEVADAISSANEYGVSPDEIVVSLQIDGPQTESVWATDVEFHYDNDAQASGCVLLGEFSGHDS